MYPKFKEISLDTATWTVAFLGAIEERETKSKKAILHVSSVRWSHRHHSKSVEH